MAVVPGPADNIALWINTVRWVDSPSATLYSPPHRDRSPHCRADIWTAAWTTYTRLVHHIEFTFPTHCLQDFGRDVGCAIQRRGSILPVPSGLHRFLPPRFTLFYRNKACLFPDPFLRTTYDTPRTLHTLRLLFAFPFTPLLQGFSSRFTAIPFPLPVP